MKSMIEMNENCDVQTKRKIEKLGKFILWKLYFYCVILNQAILYLCVNFYFFI